MKKIITASLFLAIAATGNAQTGNSKGTITASGKVAQPGQQADPMVNGMPYSQWKAKCAADKAKQEATDNELRAKTTRQREELLKSVSPPSTGSGQNPQP